MSEKLSPFDFVKEIQHGKRDLFALDPENEKSYVPFLTNKALSYDQDTILFANEMNQRHHLDKRMQHAYLLRIVRARRRGFHKWQKTVKSDALEAVKTYWGCSTNKAMEALKILSAAQIENVIRLTDKGGRVGKAK